MQTVGQKLFELRVKKGWSLTQASEATGFHKSSIQNWEVGHRRPKRDTLIQLAAVYGVDYNELDSLPTVDISTAIKTPDIDENSQLLLVQRVAALTPAQAHVVNLFIDALLSC